MRPFAPHPFRHPVRAADHKVLRGVDQRRVAGECRVVDGSALEDVPGDDSDSRIEEHARVPALKVEGDLVTADGDHRVEVLPSIDVDRADLRPANQFEREDHIRSIDGMAIGPDSIIPQEVMEDGGVASELPPVSQRKIIDGILQSAILPASRVEAEEEL